MDDGDQHRALAFLGTPLPRWVNRREVCIEPGAARPYDEAEWRDALVIVEAGEVTLECTRGGFTSFCGGDILWLVGVPLRTMHNLGPRRVVVVAVSRRADIRPARRNRPDCRHPDPTQAASSCAP